ECARSVFVVAGGKCKPSTLKELANAFAATEEHEIDLAPGLQRQAERIRSVNPLGEADRLGRPLEYLVAPVADPDEVAELRVRDCQLGAGLDRFQELNRFARHALCLVIVSDPRDRPREFCESDTLPQPIPSATSKLHDPRPERDDIPWIVKLSPLVPPG